MIEKGLNGLVWRPMFAPVPIKSLVVEPVAIWIVRGSGWTVDDVMNFDKMALTVDTVMRNTANRDLETLVGIVEVHIGQVLIGSFNHQGGLKSGESMSNSITALLDGSSSMQKSSDAITGPEVVAFFDAINAQDPSRNPVVSVMVTGDFHTPMRGPMGKLTVANQAVSIKNLTINRRSGSPVRTHAEV